MAYRIELSSSADEEIRRLRLFDQRRVGEAIRDHLAGQPEVETRNRKCLGGDPEADFEYEPPLWELRVGEYRVFYEVDGSGDVVYVHAVRRKPPDKTTAEVLNEADDR